jgi:dGTPase
VAPWAVGEQQSGGRKVPETPHPYRSCFQRDRDRIVHCSAFRRLDFKTQVFVPHEHDHFRTRLTHTLEVAQIARTLGRALGLSEDLLEAVALAHDLGHPPFGHGGEEALDELMADHGGFEHNRQSLRIVDYLEHPYPQFRGLNLTHVVRECLAKHETRYDAPASEEFDPSLAAPLAGQVVDLADEIAYTAADLEDALAAGNIQVEQLGDLALWRQAWQAAEADAGDARPIHKRIRACKAVLAAMADDAIRTTAANIDALAIRSPDDARRAGRRCAAFSPERKAAVEQMQDFLLHNVYLCGDNVAHDRKGRRMIRELFEAFVGDPSLLPGRYRGRIGRDADASPCRVACDYIAGMTDRFCKQQHARICT